MMEILKKTRKSITLTSGKLKRCFFNDPFLVYEDVKHSRTEILWYALGRTDSNLELMVVFTLRKNLIRVISARKMNKKERVIYENL